MSPAGGTKFFKSIAQRELLSILSDDALSLYSEMLIIKVHAAPPAHDLNRMFHAHNCVCCSSCTHAAGAAAEWSGHPLALQLQCRGTSPQAMSRTPGTRGPDAHASKSAHWHLIKTLTLKPVKTPRRWRA